MSAMRMSKLFLRTLRDDPADAEVDSHRLLLRAGYLRRVSAGVYSWLPLGQRVLRKVTEIVRSEMDAAGAQEVLLPALQPLDLWARTGRDIAYGPLMFRMQDRKEAAFCLAPTAEEVITATVAGEYSSYRDLPVNLYQIGWKYRDELRPRFGLLRAREFLMKDAYSFDVDVEGLRATYATMYDAYHRVFGRCGLTFRPVEAQAGEIGGDVNHEFMAVAAVGEDDFVWCRSCDYAANVEAAVRGPVGTAPAVPTAAPPVARVHTPGAGDIDDVATVLAVDASETLKCLAFDVDGALALALVPGDREVNVHAVARLLAPRVARLFEDADFERHLGVPRGFIGPANPDATLVVADPAVEAGHPAAGWVTGADEVDHHVRHAVLRRDFEVHVWGDIAAVATGDPCPRCGAELSVDRGIEVGHTFQLGTKYSTALDATFTDEHGGRHPMVMGCYGIGVSRIVAAVVEEHHDEGGLVWPAALAPYDLHLVSLLGKAEGAGEVAAAADALYERLVAAGCEVLYDDRAVSPGVKFADADLLGVPVQLVIGSKGLSRGVAERKLRSTGGRDELQLDALAGQPSLALRFAAVSP